MADNAIRPANHQTKADLLLEHGRAKQVYDLLLAGKTQAEIARTLKVSDTVVADIVNTALNELTPRIREQKEIVAALLDARLEDLYAIARERVVETPEVQGLPPVNWRAFDSCLKIIKERDRLLSGTEVKKQTSITIEAHFEPTVASGSELYEEAFGNMKLQYNPIIDSYQSFQQEVDKQLETTISQDQAYEPPALLSALEEMVTQYVERTNTDDESVDRET